MDNYRYCHTRNKQIVMMWHFIFLCLTENMTFGCIYLALLLFYFNLKNEMYAVSQNFKSQSWEMANGIVITIITEIYCESTLHCSKQQPCGAGTIVLPFQSLGSEAQRDTPGVHSHPAVDGGAWLPLHLSLSSLGLHQGEETSSLCISRHPYAYGPHFGATGPCHLTYLGMSDPSHWCGARGIGFLEAPFSIMPKKKSISSHN